MIEFQSNLSSTPDKPHYTKLRAAFVTPGPTGNPTHPTSYARMNDNDLPFVLMMQQQENAAHVLNDFDTPQEQQQTKTHFFSGNESENETAPDDFILVEVVKCSTIRMNIVTFASISFT